VNSKILICLDFPEYKTDGSDEFISPAISFDDLGSDDKTFRISVLAEEAQILFSSDEQWQGKPGLIIDLLSGMFFCYNLTKDVDLNKPSNCIKGVHKSSENFISVML
jgi:hypothetical protein